MNLSAWQGDPASFDPVLLQLTAVLPVTFGLLDGGHGSAPCCPVIWLSSLVGQLTGSSMAA